MCIVMSKSARISFCDLIGGVLQNFPLSKLALYWTGVLPVLLTACYDDGMTVVNTSVQPDIQVKNEVVTSSLPKRKGTVDACPRLIQKRIDNTQIVRQESIADNSCDYFIYPQIGEVVSVKLSNDVMKPTLRTPHFHDFNNGSYSVVNNGRHVIHVEYDAFVNKPGVVDFTIEVDIRPKN